MNAADVMTKNVVAAAPETPLAELIHLMLDNRISAIPVLEYGRIVGIVSEGDLVRRAETGTEIRRPHWLEMLTSGTRLAADYARTHGRRAGEVMTRDVVSVTETTPLADIVQLFATRHIRRVPVIRDGVLVGIVSRRDLLRALASRLDAAPVNKDDAAIRDAFLTEVRKQPWAAWPVEVGVVVSDGVVHLWGAAPNEEKRLAMRVAAENIPGVRGVEDHMEHLSEVDPMDRPNWPKPAPP
jgi:CBS domain-containing protein